MRELQLIKWCDVCNLEGGDDDVREIAVGSWTVAAVAGEATRPAVKVLDLCEAHGKAIADLAELLTHISQLPGPTAPPAAKAAPTRYVPDKTYGSCPVCRRQVEAKSLTTHIWANHRTDSKPSIPTTCPECGEHLPTPQGMAAHRRLAHGYDSVADALSGVKGYKPPALPKAKRGGQLELEAQ